MRKGAIKDAVTSELNITCDIVNKDARRRRCSKSSGVDEGEQTVPL
jgi:hypothetical protein